VAGDRRAEPAQRLVGRAATAAADLEDLERAAVRGHEPGQRLRADRVVDGVEQVVVGEVLQPQRQLLRREEDLVAGRVAREEALRLVHQRLQDLDGDRRAWLAGGEL